MEMKSSKAVIPSPSIYTIYTTIYEDSNKSYINKAVRPHSYFVGFVANNR